MTPRICWIDDYPTPIRTAVQAALDDLVGIPVDSYYLHPSGAHEGRHFPVPALPKHSVGGAVLRRAIASCAEDTDSVLICELALPLIPVLVRSRLWGARCRRVVIVGHGPTQGVRALHPKNMARQIIAWAAPRIFDRCLFYSEMSRRYSRPPAAARFVVSYGSVLPPEPSRDAAGSEPAPNLRARNPSAVHVLLAGAWSGRKGFATTVRALEALSSPSRPMVVHHAGEVSARIRRHFPRVQFHGYVHDGARLQELRAQCDLGILASRNEPWGHVVLENMAAGLPTVVTAYCGSADAVRQLDPQLVVPACTEREITRAVTRYIARPAHERTNLRVEAQRIASAHSPSHLAHAIASLVADRATPPPHAPRPREAGRDAGAVAA